MDVGSGGVQKVKSDSQMSLYLTLRTQEKQKDNESSIGHVVADGG